MKTYDFVSEAELQTWAEKLACNLKGGETIELVGDVGAGKTTFTKALAKGLGITAPVQSPTFTISNRYKAPGGLTLAHYDFYRLGEAGVMGDELDETMADPRTVTVIEWSDIVRGVLPSDRLTIGFAVIDDTSRHLMVTGHGERSKVIEEKLA